LPDLLPPKSDYHGMPSMEDLRKLEEIQKLTQMEIDHMKRALSEAGIKDKPTSSPTPEKKPVEKLEAPKPKIGEKIKEE